MWRAHKSIQVGLKKGKVSHLYFTDDSDLFLKEYNDSFVNVLLLIILSHEDCLCLKISLIKRGPASLNGDKNNSFKAPAAASQVYRLIGPSLLLYHT